MGQRALSVVVRFIRLSHRLHYLEFSSGQEFGYLLSSQDQDVVIAHDFLDSLSVAATEQVINV